MDTGMNVNSNDIRGTFDNYESETSDSSSNFARGESKPFSGATEGVAAGQVEEGSITKQIESFTTKIPSATFLSLAMGSMAISALLRLAGKRHEAIFVGEWVPTILILGLYNKLVKLEGSEGKSAN